MINYFFFQSRIVKGNNSLKEPRAYSIATSRRSPAELDVSRDIGTPMPFPIPQNNLEAVE